MKKLISLMIAMFLTVSSLAACAAKPTDSVTASDDTAAKYTAFLEERLAEMPDTLVIGDEAKAAEHGIDMADFEDEGFFTRAVGGEVLIFGKTDAGIDRAVRDFVKYGNCDVYSKTYGEGYRVERLTIAGNDISEYAIIYDSVNQSGVEEPVFAAEQLSMYIEKTCGAVLPYYTDVEFAALEEKPERTITLTVDYPALGNDAFRIEVDDSGDLTVFGGRNKGCIYGVYDLLEENVGWRFFDNVLQAMVEGVGSSDEYLYEAEHIDLTSEINRTEEPLFLSRRMDDVNYYKRLNGEHAGQYNYYSYKRRISDNWYSGHGLNQVDWTGTSFEGGGDQPCLSDEEILERIDEHVLEYVEKRIDMGYVPGRDFYGLSLGQYDGLTGYCQCVDCLQIVAEEGSGAGPYVRAANRAAQLLKDNGYGYLHVNILAYVDTSTPPKKTMPLDNVRVSYCFYVLGDMDVCSAHTIDGKECPETGYTSNHGLAERFERWAAVCAPGNMDVWYYPFHSGNAIAPAPVVLKMYDDIKYLSEHGVGAIINTVGGSASQFSALTEYLLDNICWQLPESYDAYLDMIREWLWLNYGDAADPIFDYIIEYHKLGKNVACYTMFYDRTSPLVHVNQGDMLGRFDYFCDLFERAYELADTSVQVERIEHLEAGMLYLGVCHAYKPWYVNGTADEKALLIERYTRLHELVTKNNMWIFVSCTYDDFHYAPEELDLDENPIMWYAKPAGQSDGVGDLFG